MLDLTQQSLAFQQERSQLTDMLQAQHVSMQQLIEETQTQEAALHGLSQHAQEADQQVMQSFISPQIRSWHIQEWPSSTQARARFCIS